MIKIIKKGTKRTCTCEDCGCYFSYDDGVDTEERESDMGITADKKALRYIPFYEKIIRCPQCKNVIILEAAR